MTLRTLDINSVTNPDTNSDINPNIKQVGQTLIITDGVKDGVKDEYKIPNTTTLHFSITNPFIYKAKVPPWYALVRGVAEFVTAKVRHLFGLCKVFGRKVIT